MTHPYITKHPIYSLLCFAVFMLLISSCKKDEFNKDGLFVYAPSGTASYNVLRGDSLLVLRNTIISGSGAAFPVLITRSFDKDVQVTAAIDTSLIRIYDSTNNTKSPSLPDGAFTLVNKGTVTIQASKTTSGDSIRVQLADATKLKTGINTYIVPVVLSSATNGIPVSNNRQVMFLQFVVTSIATGITSLTGANMVDIVLENAGGVNTGVNIVYLRAVLNKAIGNPVTINVEDNAELVQAFNTSNKTSYVPFPSGAFQLTKSSAIIPSGATISKDSINISLPDLSKFQKGADYLLAIRLKENTSTDVPPADLTKNIVYVHVSVFVNNVDPSNQGLTGSSMARSSWSVTASASTIGPATAVLDGDNSTSWFTSGLAWLQLNMGASKTVKGFSIVPNYMYGRSYNFINMDVLSSDDGNSWKLQGRYAGSLPASSSSAASPDLKTVKFITPVTARYFKFNVTKNSSGYSAMAELNGIE